LAFAALGLSRLASFISPGNVRSIRGPARIAGSERCVYAISR